MILVIPSIELTEGICPHCIVGEKGTEDFYKRLSENPLGFCKLWRRENARSINIRDNDSYDGKDNDLNQNAVMFIAQEMDIPIQYSANFRDVEQCRMFLDSGVFRLVISDLLFSDPEGVRILIEDYTSSRIAFGMTSEGGTGYFERADNEITPFDFIGRIKEVGGDRMIYGEKNWSGDAGINFEQLLNIVISTKIKITLNQGVNGPEDLWRIAAMAKYGLDSVILGYSLYLNAFPCQKIWRQIEAKLEK
jgi:phosphoribosylformimino-5-aminoimidazole carboxamide ribonucleotide (ProFAR) isomerase